MWPSTTSGSSGYALSDPAEATEVMEQPDLDDGRSLRETFRALSDAQRDVLLCGRWPASRRGRSRNASVRPRPPSTRVITARAAPPSAR